MSVPPTKILRSAASRLWWYAVTALRKDVPLPVRLTCLEVLKINLDQLFTPSTLWKMWPLINQSIKYVIQYMRDLGYEVSDLDVTLTESSVTDESLMSTEEETSLDKVIRWIRKEFKKKEGESVMEYLDRVAHFAARLLAVYSIVTAEVM